jgi:hypothetical protein
MSMTHMDQEYDIEESVAAAGESEESATALTSLGQISDLAARCAAFEAALASIQRSAERIEQNLQALQGWIPFLRSLWYWVRNSPFCARN